MFANSSVHVLPFDSTYGADNCRNYASKVAFLFPCDVCGTCSSNTSSAAAHEFKQVPSTLLQAVQIDCLEQFVWCDCLCARIIGVFLKCCNILNTLSNHQTNNLNSLAAKPEANYQMECLGGGGGQTPESYPVREFLKARTIGACIAANHEMGKLVTRPARALSVACRVGRAKPTSRNRLLGYHVVRRPT